MADQPRGRAVGAMENSWCRAVPGGTGITVLGFDISRAPDMLKYQTALHKLQNAHPILNSRLHTNTKMNTFSFVTSPTPFVQIKTFDLSSTMEILETLSNPSNNSVSPFHLILEHELNKNTWTKTTTTTSSSSSSSASTNDQDMFFGTIYTLPNAKWVAVMRLHVSACDHTTAETMLRELLGYLIGGTNDGEGRGIEKEIGSKGEVNSGIEDLVPSRIAKKPFWARGVDMLSYSLNSLRLTNLKFKDTKSARSSQVVRFQMNQEETQRILDGCKAKGIKLCGALVAAGLMAADKCSKHHQKKKYGILTLIDCRSNFDPALSIHHFGNYHSVIPHIHTIKGGENLWELAKKTYTAFASSKNSDKHFTDLAALSFVMCKAIENPALTPSSSLRSSFMTVFEDTIIDDYNDMQRELGVDDYIGCASVHGIGPSIAIFDTIRNGRLDCVCVYPSPLHAREQMQELVDNMKKILVDLV
ncbi:PREDICTED: uncharacterized protein LOC103341758 [Prunus mume]|uniref:Uncharacterized protein LOC103341758 n=1 Tax=Prunus mume TaxID=102107 RepID=A0ABM0PRV2_PRUMU|nr:PREDICTED: uncharacterized protein LOC103341758 [Prunus mume]